jgi:hypothetical protein
MNVILDTGSSALALDGHKYQPEADDKTTDLAQTDAYGDGSSWTGAVINSTVKVGSGNSTVTLNGANVAVAYDESANMFGDSDGILGLAYAALDDAFKMPGDTWKNQYTETEVRSGGQGPIQPYLTQLASQGVTSDRISFVTHRSFVHEGGGDENDPLNQGVMVLGGTDADTTDLYTGAFQTVKVVSDAWYCTSLKSVVVGKSDPIIARINGPKGMPSNSIIDSGTNSLNLSHQLLEAIMSKFPTAQKTLLSSSIKGGKLVPTSKLNLAEWPTITFILQGDAGDVSLDVPPANYWQMDTQSVGAAAAAITPGEAGLAILGLPLMNGYFTVFDGEADGGKGVVKFAQLKK